MKESLETRLRPASETRRAKQAISHSFDYSLCDCLIEVHDIEQSKKGDESRWNIKAHGMLHRFHLNTNHHVQPKRLHAPRLRRARPRILHKLRQRNPTPHDHPQNRICLPLSHPQPNNPLQLSLRPRTHHTQTQPTPQSSQLHCRMGTTSNGSQRRLHPRKQRRL